MSTFYDLYDTNNTPYDTSDDTLVYASGGLPSAAACGTPCWTPQNPVSAAACDGLDLAQRLGAHRQRPLGWPDLPAAHLLDRPEQRRRPAQLDRLNAFAIWSKATGGTPRVYGLGAMEAYVRLPGGRSTEFYLAQIDAEHAGKTMVISSGTRATPAAWRPTCRSSQPTGTDYQADDVQLQRASATRTRRLRAATAAAARTSAR